MTLALGRQVLETEARAILAIAERLGPEFDAAVDLLASCRGRIVTTGMGKSGIVCRKIAATLSSTGSASFFLHPAEAIHGDLGMVAEGDVVLAASNSGETEEIVRLLEHLKRMGVAILALTGKPTSTLAQNADVHLSVAVDREACPNNLAPTASTTATLAVGDALAMALSVRRGFRAEDFAELHPGGKLGKKLAKVRDLMHGGERVPKVEANTLLKDVIHEMSAQRLGMTTVQADGRLLGVVSDGDLRRLFERDPAPLGRRAADIMTPTPSTITADRLASEALHLMEERKITSVVVVDDERRVLGVLHLHDLWGVDLF